MEENKYGSNVGTGKSQGNRHILVIPKKYFPFGAHLNENTLNDMIITGMKAQDKINTFLNQKINKSLINKQKRKELYNMKYTSMKGQENVENFKTQYTLAFHLPGHASIPYAHLHVIPVGHKFNNENTRRKYLHTAQMHLNAIRKKS